jgi:putative ABC transport system permease protein
MGSLVKDLRFAIRQLAKSRGFTFVAILSIALGIGANTAIFSLVDALLLRPLAVQNPEELVSINASSEKGNGKLPVFSYPNYCDIRDRNDVLAGLIAYRFATVNLSHDGINERLWGYLATGNYFDILGIKPVRGRLFTKEDDKAPGAHPVLVITYNCWHNRFGGDINIVGKRVIINGRDFTVIGVTPEGFYGTEVGYVPEMWFPMMMMAQIDPGNNGLRGRDRSNLFAVGRLNPGVSFARAEASLKVTAAQLVREYPDINDGLTIKLSLTGLFGSLMRGPVSSFAGALMFTVVLVLLLACMNLANLLLARATERRKEIAIRLAIGASRLRLLRQLLTESVLLALIGGALGVLLAYWFVKFVTTVRPPTDAPYTINLQIDHRVLVFSIAVSLLTGIAFGLLPALQSTKPDLAPALKDEVSAVGYRRSLLRHGLVVSQVALSLVLLIAGGLVARGLQRASLSNPGFVPQNAIEMSFDLGLQGYDGDRSKVFKQELLNKVRALPGVQYAGLADYVPLDLNIRNSSIHVEGQPQSRGTNAPSAMNGSAGPGFLQAFGTALLQGRDFTEQDDETKPRKALVNETFARRFWKGEPAVGKRFSFESPEGPWVEVIGVIQDGKYLSLGEDAAPFVYSNMQQDSNKNLNLVVRGASEPQSLIVAVRREIQRLDGNLPIYNTKTLVDHLNLSLFPARVAASLLGGFGVLALVLAAIGIFGVMSYVVSQRTREIGIRMALGASAAYIFRTLVGHGLLLTVIGSLFGLLFALLGTRLISSLFYGVSNLDPLTFACGVLLLTAVSFLACFFPARKAMKVDPIIALRNE